MPLPVVASAQFTLSPLSLSEGKAQTSTMAGKAAFDIVRLEANRLSTPLKHGHVIPGSERVELDARTLVRDQDYSLDAAAGTIYLKVPVKPGQSLRVSYRYDDTKANTGVHGGVTGSSQALAFTLTPGTQAVIGMGYTERLADGTVLSGNVFGLTNSFSLGTGTLKGVMMLNEREKAQVNSLFGNESSGKTEDGKGAAIIQELQTGALGGTVTAKYQDVEDNFAAFDSLKMAGYDQKAINAFAKERGLKRSSLSLDKAGAGAFRFGGGYETIGDESGAITWRNANVSIGSMSMNYSSQYVDPDFKKFSNLRNEDAAQLAKERGLERQTLSFANPGKASKFNYDYLSVTDKDEVDVWRSNLGLEASGIKVSWFRQSVHEEFSRFGDLREGDKGQLAKERGVDRNAFALSGKNFNYSRNLIDTEDGGVKSTDFAMQGKGWSVEHRFRGVDSNFRNYGALKGEDINEAIGGIASMYGPKMQPHQNDAKSLGNLSGYDRNNWRLAYSSGGFQSMLNQVSVSGPDGSVHLRELSLQNGATSLSIKEQKADEDFDMRRGLMATEQGILGSTDGLQKTDISFSTNLSKNQKLQLNWMDALTEDGDASRRAFSYVDKGFNFAYTRRSVDQDFRDVARIIDPEAKTLASLLGFDQTEISGSWQVMKGLNLQHREYSGINSVLDQQIGFRESSISWQLMPNTHLTHFQGARSFVDGGDTLQDHAYDRTAITQSFNGGHKLTLTHETSEFNGDNDKLKDAERRALAVETKLDPKTTLKTEHSEIKFEDGTRETSRSNTLATQITSRFGVSVTDTKILRDGDEKDETRRNYGFWVDFGKGVKLTYGYNRDLRGEDFGTKQTETTLSPGEVGGIKVDSASYKQNRVDDKRDQHFGNVSLSNLKPFSLGMFHDIKFHYKTDTYRDQYLWKKEDVSLGLQTTVGGVGLGWDYFSQVHTEGYRAIDRTFSLVTDPTNKKPFRLSAKYGVRTLPNDETTHIRDYNLFWQINKNFSLSHALATNSLQAKQNIVLGSHALDERKNSYTVAYQNDKRFAFDLNWNEIKRDDQKETLRREARANMKMFAHTGSPLEISYALQQWHRRNETGLSHAFGLTFSQKPSLNQAFSVSVEHLQWVGGKPRGGDWRDWGLRLDYNLRF
ncbi:hypothetical protein QM565_27140 [Geitlerinema splendidum]|nr:hypothetical protein [Geitlerinema splendidum]